MFTEGYWAKSSHQIQGVIQNRKSAIVWGSSSEPPEQSTDHSSPTPISRSPLPVSLFTPSHTIPLPSLHFRFLFHSNYIVYIISEYDTMYIWLHCNTEVEEWGRDRRVMRDARSSVRIGGITRTRRGRSRGSWGIVWEGVRGSTFLRMCQHD